MTKAMTDQTSTSTVKTRPARPGDILASAAIEGVGRWQVVLLPKPEHAASGIDSPPTVACRGTLWLKCDGCVYLDDALLDRKASVLGRQLRDSWGSYDGGGERHMSEDHTGETIPSLVVMLTRRLSEAIAQVAAVRDAHMASVAAHDSRHAAACAAWPVFDDA